MTKKMVVAMISVVLTSSFMVGCGSTEEDSGVDTGVVISRARKSVTVLEDDGETDRHRVSKSISRRCSVGERWPDCKRS